MARDKGPKGHTVQGTSVKRSPTVGSCWLGPEGALASIISRSPGR